MVIFGFMLNYALRVNLTIAIVEMLDGTSASHEAAVNETTTSATIEANTTLASVISEKVAKFDWSEKEKQMILGSFFWGYILTELPGGRLAELIGGHRVFGHSMLWASVLTLITPFAANMGVVAMVILRVVLGFMLGGKFNQDYLKYFLYIVATIYSFMACNSSNDCRLDSTNGSIEVYVKHDGFGTWSSCYDANLWLFDLLVWLAERFLCNW